MTMSITKRHNRFIPCSLHSDCKKIVYKDKSVKENKFYSHSLWFSKNFCTFALINYCMYIKS